MLFAIGRAGQNGARGGLEHPHGIALVDERILVSIDEGNTVRVFKATTRTVLSCSPNCEEHVTTGATAAAK